MKLKSEESAAIKMCEILSGTYMRTADIAEKAGISHTFVEVIAGKLKRNKVIQVKRGPNGGYRLYPKGTNYLKIITAVSGPLNIDNLYIKTAFEEVLTNRVVSRNKAVAHDPQKYHKNVPYSPYSLMHPQNSKTVEIDIPTSKLGRISCERLLLLRKNNYKATWNQKKQFNKEDVEFEIIKRKAKGLM